MNKLFLKIAGFAGIVLLVSGLIKYYTDGFFSTATIIVLMVGLALTLFNTVKNFELIKNFFQRRATQNIGNALVVSLFMVSIIGLLNYVSNKHSFRVDFTENKQFTLADQTIKVLQNLEKNTKVTAFFRSTDKASVEDLISEYQYYSSNLEFAFFDPDKSPEVANNYGIQTYGMLILESDGKSERVEILSEQTLTNALIKVTREGSKVIYFMMGHGEHDIESLEKKGFGSLKEKIVELNYQVEGLNLAREKSVPVDCSVLIVNGPKTNLFSAELDSIDSYINHGGKVLFLLDPPPDPGMEDFFDNWGITVGSDLIVDYSGVGQMFGYPASVPLVTNYNTSHPIAANFNMNTFFELVRSVTPKSENIPAGITVDWLAQTTPQSWGESNFQWNTEKPDEGIAVSFDDGVDIEGPVTIASVATKSLDSAPGPGLTGDRGVLVVFGDSDFATNNYVQTPNSILFLNTVNWLAEEEDLVAIPPKNPEDRRINMTAQQAKFSLVLTVFIIPGLVLIAGLSVYFRRRKL